MKLFLIRVGILFLLVMAFVVYCCMVMASIADRQMEKLKFECQFDEQQKDKTILPK